MKYRSQIGNLHLLFLKACQDHWWHKITLPELSYSTVCLQCFDDVGWAAGRASGL